MRAHRLDIHPVDQKSPIPLYHQVECDLRRLILEEKLQPGAIMPPEHQLSEVYQVSRHTIRQALSRIESDDLISRNAGIGTIVKPRKDLTSLSVERSFTREMEASGYSTHSLILEQSFEKVTEAHPGVLEDRLGESCFNLHRLRFAEGEPVCLQCSTILTKKCAGIDQYDFSSASLYKILAEVYNLFITDIKYSLSAQSANAELAQYLNIDERSALLVVKTTALLVNGEILEHSQSFYRADRYDYSITHHLRDKST